MYIAMLNHHISKPQLDDMCSIRLIDDNLSYQKQVDRYFPT